MKELTTKQKAKCYDEALERAKSKIKNDNDHVLYEDDIIEMFPELKESKESKDEKIRKHLICLFQKDYGTNSFARFAGIKVKDILSWLEKEAEHANFRNKIQIGDKVTRNTDGVLVNLSRLERVAKKDEKQCEQKPYGLREECKDCQCNYVGECKGSCAMKRNEQKPAWREDDELMFVSIIQTLKLTNGAAQMKIDWLNAVKCRVGNKVNCTTARKWSGVDEELCEHLIKSIEVSDPLPTSIYSDCKKWLKSLKDRYSWMPSDGQMAAIDGICSYIRNKADWEISQDMVSDLYELFEQLKKLREE